MLRKHSQYDEILKYNIFNQICKLRKHTNHNQDKKSTEEHTVLVLLSVVVWTYTNTYKPKKCERNIAENIIMEC